MASTASSRLQLEIMADGENEITWGGKTNTNLEILESAVTGIEAIALSASDVTLTDVQYVDDQAKKAILNLTGPLTADVDIIIPNRERIYKVINQTTSTGGPWTVGIKTTSGSSKLVTQGSSAEVFCDGANTVLFVSPNTITTTGAAAAGGTTAATVSCVAGNGLVATDVQAALDEHQTDINTINDTSLPAKQGLNDKLTSVSGLSIGKGNLISGDAADTFVSVGAGTDGYILVAKASASGGVQWTSVVESGTAAVFYQEFAPTNWTAVAQNDKALRVVSSGTTGGAASGTTAFSSVLTSRTLTGDQIPAHTHGPGSLTGTAAAAGDHAHALNTASNTSIGGSSNRAVGTSGGSGFTDTNGAHIHTVSITAGVTGNAGSGNPIDFAIQYCDVIIATKDAY